jgi:hypothetical protein
VTSSAAARAGAEGIWLPTALLLELELRLDGAGHIVSLQFDRYRITGLEPAGPTAEPR